MASAQNWRLDWYSSVSANYGTGEYLPFWQRTGNDGTLPFVNAGIGSIGLDFSYKAENGFFVETGTHVLGSVGKESVLNRKVDGLIDRLYASLGWRMLRLDVGMLPREREISELSVTGGNIIYTGNARNIPGINFSTDWIFFEKGHWFGIRANFAHYQMIDNRYVKGAMLHNKSLAFVVAEGRIVDFEAGLEHWAQWGGNSPQFGPQPVRFSDYVRIVLAQEGGSGSVVHDTANALGNHLGREYFRIRWSPEPFVMTFQYDKPFEDFSGVKFQNAPDGVWTLHFSLKNRNGWITDVLGEFITTTWQSGPLHDRPATEEEMENQNKDDYHYGKVVLGGCDNYFGNYMYRSGWTNHGRIIGLPLIIQNKPDEAGVVNQMASTRLRAYHLGLAGVLDCKVPYSFKCTYSNNYGTYFQNETSRFVSPLWQLSMALDVTLNNKFLKVPLDLTLGVYGDVGELYQKSVGVSLKLQYKDGLQRRTGQK